MNVKKGKKKKKSVDLCLKSEGVRKNSCSGSGPLFPTDFTVYAVRVDEVKRYERKKGKTKRNQWIYV